MQSIRDRLKETIELRAKATQGFYKGYTQRDGAYSELQVWVDNKHIYTLADAERKLENDNKNFKFLAHSANNIETYARALLIALDALDQYADRENYRFIERDNPNNGMRARSAKEKIEKLFEVGHD